MRLKCRITSTIPWFGFSSGLGATMILSTFVMLGFSAALAGKGPTVDKEPGLAKAPASSGQQWRGTLAAGDLKLSTGEYYDTYDFEGRKGQTVHIRMTSSAVDPYLGLHFGDKSLLENDDAATGEGALITTTLEQDGTYTVFATSYKPGEKGDYLVVLDGAGGGGGGATPSASGPTRGSLASGDDKLDSGEFVDKYTYPCAAGSHLSARVTSSDFDTYVGLDVPGQDRKENDDAATGSGALVEATVTQSGTCVVYVTSYKAGEVGDYTLEVSGFGAAGSSGPPVASSSTDTIGPDLEAALQAWIDGFKGHKGAADTPEMTYTEYDTDLRMNGAARVKVVEHRSFGIPGQTTLTGEYGSFADEAAGLVAYRALAARVQNSNTPCCSFVASETDAEVLHNTSWIPFDLAGRMGPLKQAMIQVELMKVPKLEGTNLIWQWDLDLTILHTP